MLLQCLFNTDCLLLLRFMFFGCPFNTVCSLCKVCVFYSNPFIAQAAVFSFSGLILGCPIHTLTAFLFHVCGLKLGRIITDCLLLSDFLFNTFFLLQMWCVDVTIPVNRRGYKHSPIFLRRPRQKHEDP